MSALYINVECWLPDGNTKFVEGRMGKDDIETRELFDNERKYNLDKSYNIKCNKIFKKYYIGSYVIDLVDNKRQIYLSTITIPKERYIYLTTGKMVGEQ